MPITVTNTSTYQSAEGTVTVKTWSDGSTTSTLASSAPASDVAAAGLVLPSPDTTLWRITVDNSGTLVRTTQ